MRASAARALARAGDRELAECKKQALLDVLSAIKQYKLRPMHNNLCVLLEYVCHTTRGLIEAALFRDEGMNAMVFIKPGLKRLFDWDIPNEELTHIKLSST